MHVPRVRNERTSWPFPARFVTRFVTRPQNHPQRKRPTQARKPRRAVRFPGVGLARLERATSRLSGVRSNHLSYRPGEDEKRTASPPLVQPLPTPATSGPLGGVPGEGFRGEKTGKRFPEIRKGFPESRRIDGPVRRGQETASNYSTFVCWENPGHGISHAPLRRCSAVAEGVPGVSFITGRQPYGDTVHQGPSRHLRHRGWKECRFADPGS